MFNNIEYGGKQMNDNVKLLLAIIGLFMFVVFGWIFFTDVLSVFNGNLDMMEFNRNWFITSLGIFLASLSTACFFWLKEKNK